MVHPRLRRPLLRLLLALSPALPALAAPAADGVPFAGFPFHIPPAGTTPGTAPAALGLSARPSEARVAVRDGHFVLSGTGEPIRFWGVNICFAGAFPDHATADRVALRLASLGVNIVRFHHMDWRRFPSGIWSRDARGATDAPREGDIEHRALDPEALDRLDYFISRLKRSGIYSDLNLKVSRTYSTFDGPAFPAPLPGEIVPKKGKGFDLFYPPAIDAQKTYARLLLTHLNPYTGATYAAEPAVAVVEVNNENGLIWAYNHNLLDRLPAPYLAALAARWDDWLRSRYAGTAALRAAWSAASSGAPSAGLLSSDKARLVTASGARATATPLPADNATRLAVTDLPASGAWHVRYNWPLSALRVGSLYRVTLRLRANRPEKLRLRLRPLHAAKPADLAGSHTLSVGPAWQDYAVTFALPADADAPDAQLTLELGRAGLVLDVSEVSMRASVPAGLADGEGLGGGERPVSWVPRSGLPGRTPACVADVMRFLRDTEVAYGCDMRSYLHDTLHVAAPVTITAVGYTTSQIAAETADFVDTHRYWGAPHFPGYDRSKPWTVEQKSMVAHPAESSIERLSARRVFGLPFTVTEYNHPPSSDYHAEGFPLLAVWGAAQDWDGLFEFDYAGGANWDSDTLTGFFDTEPNPAHTVVALAASDLFRHRRIAPFPSARAACVPLDRQLARQNNHGFPHDIEADAVFGGLPADAWLRQRVGLVLRPGEKPPVLAAPSAPQRLDWEAADPASAHCSYVGEGVAGLVGFVSGRTLDLGWLRLTPGDTSLNGFSVVMLNAVDGQDLGAPGRYLLTAVVRAANRDMGWNAARTGFGSQWGAGPALAEAPPLSLDFASGSVRVFPLNPDGTRKNELPSRPAASGLRRVEATPTSRTLWYEIVIP